MDTERSIIDIIKVRTSSRTYESRLLEQNTLQKLEKYIMEINNEINNVVNFQLICTENIKTDENIKLGTYGTISGAKYFIIGIVKKTYKNYIEFGYNFEKIVLYATQLGLGTCWMGGTFNRKDFESGLQINKDEFIPIITPVGYVKDKRTIIDTLVRKMAGSKNRKPWSELFYDNTIEKSLLEIDEPYKIPLEMVRLAPSASNKQPWRIIKDKDGYNFYLSRTKGYKMLNYDIQMNDIGIAMCHFELVSYELQLGGKWCNITKGTMLDNLEYIITYKTSICTNSL